MKGLLLIKYHCEFITTPTLPAQESTSRQVRRSASHGALGLGDGKLAVVPVVASYCA